MHSRKILVWDLPTRLFHWLLAGVVIGLIITGKAGGNLIEWHGRLGLLLAGLLGFRLVWGLAGPTYARFAQFFPTPARLRTCLQGRWQQPGHNPLGALSVFALLGLLTIQLLSGLLATDDIAFSGPLAALVDSDGSAAATGWHRLLANGLLGLILLHVLAIAFHARVKKDNLLRPMLTGWKDSAQGESTRGGRLPALLAALAAGALCIWLASGSWLPSPPPAPPASQLQTPDW